MIYKHDREQSLWLARVTEKKDHLINRIPSLTADQKTQLITHFHNFPHKESMIDWNNYEQLTWKDFEGVLQHVSKSKMTKDVKASGIEGLKEGRDYTVAYSDWPVLVVIPHTWEASKQIASRYVGGIEGEWCTAYQKDDSFWYSHVRPNTSIYKGQPKVNRPHLFYAIDFERERKIAIIYRDGYRNDMLFDTKDYVDFPVEVYNEQDKLVGCIDFLRFLFPKDLPRAFSFKGEKDDGAVINVSETGRFSYSDTAKKMLTKSYDFLEAAAAHAPVNRNKPADASKGYCYDDVWDGGDFDGDVMQWDGATFLNGRWLRGVWRDGVWVDGEWMTGTWKNGRWVKGTWHDGTWRRGWIYDPEKKGNFQDNWPWDRGWVKSPISPKEYFS